MNSHKDMPVDDEKDWILFQLLEGDLSPEEETEVRKKILLDQEWALAWEQMQAVVLDASEEQGLSPTQKRTLIKSFPLFGASWQRWAAAAVFLIIAGGAWFFMDSNEFPVTKDMVRESQQDDIIPLNTVTDTLLPIKETDQHSNQVTNKRQNIIKKDFAPRSDNAIPEVQFAAEPVHMHTRFGMDQIRFPLHENQHVSMPEPLKVKLRVNYHPRITEPLVIKQSITRIQQRINREIYALSAPRLQVRRKQEGLLPVFELAFHSAGYEAVARLELKQEIIKPLNKSSHE